MNNKKIAQAVKATIEAINTDGRLFEPVREVVQTELEEQIDKLRLSGEMIDSDPIMEDINISFSASYAPDDAKKPEMRELVKTLADYLEESHNEAIYSEFNDDAIKGDEFAQHEKAEPKCTYCRIIKQAREALK